MKLMETTRRSVAPYKIKSSFHVPPCVCPIPGIRFPLKPSQRVAQSPRFSVQGTKTSTPRKGLNIRATTADFCLLLMDKPGICCNHHRTLGHFGACRPPRRNGMSGRRRGPWSMRSHLISNPSARILRKCERAQLPDVCQHDVYICPEEWQPVAGAQQIPCRPLVALLWRSTLPSLGYDMPMLSM